MKNYFLLILYCFFFVLPSVANEKSPVKIEKSEHTRAYFMYHGISHIITKEMGTFTKKYNIGFRNKGCNMLNITATKEHNRAVAEKLSYILGNNKWVDELPMKILGVN
jgi:hypothetical protein